MFEIGQTGELKKSISVQTTKGSKIRNYIAPPITQQDLNFYRELQKRHSKWSNRKEAFGTYNCAGMIWASRRASLPEPDDWEMILSDDGYRKIEEKHADLDDIVVYRAVENPIENEIIHLARIIRKDYLLDQNCAPIPETDPSLLALSKWDQRFGEDLHPLFDVELCGGINFKAEIWTDRPDAIPIELKEPIAMFD